jgi:hypothetical protein
MMIPSRAPQAAGKTPFSQTFPQNSRQSFRVAGAPKAIHSGPAFHAPVVPPLWSRIVHMLLPAFLTAGGIYYVNNSLNNNFDNLRNTMAEHMNMVKDSIIQGLPKEPSLKDKAVGWLGTCFIVWAAAMFGGAKGAKNALAQRNATR